MGRAYANRCGGSSEHAALIARLQTLLANDPSVPVDVGNLPDLRLPDHRQPVATRPTAAAMR